MYLSPGGWGPSEQCKNRIQLGLKDDLSGVGSTYSCIITGNCTHYRGEQLPYGMSFASLQSRLLVSGTKVEKNKWRILTVSLNLKLLRLGRL